MPRHTAIWANHRIRSTAILPARTKDVWKRPAHRARLLDGQTLVLSSRATMANCNKEDKCRSSVSSNRISHQRRDTLCPRSHHRWRWWDPQWNGLACPIVSAVQAARLPSLH